MLSLNICVAFLGVIAHVANGFYHSGMLELLQLYLVSSNSFFFLTFHINFNLGPKRWDISSSVVQRKKLSNNGFASSPSALFAIENTALSASVEDIVETGPMLSKVKREILSKRVIQRILIANNGMAATKAILSMRQWAYVTLGDERALEFVALATRDDLNANAEFIRLADTFVEVPSGSNKNNYANVDLIVKIAEEQQVDAVWPGWGHASENPKLPTNLKAKGIQFIGPTAPVMFALGDKVSANILAQTADVPSIPWSGGGIKSGLNAEGVIPQDIFNKVLTLLV